MFLNFFKFISTVFLIVIFTNFTNAQSITNYTLSATSGTFTPLVGGTTMALSGGSVDDGYFNSVPIGFTYVYMGSPFTTVSTSTNGWLTFDKTLTTSVAANNLTSGVTRPFIAPLWDDIDLQLNTNFSYQTSGSPGSQVFTAEWLNMQWNYNGTGNTISFQVKLYEATGAVEFVYRDEGGTVNSGSASIGLTALTGSGSGTFLSLDGTGVSPTASSTTETTSLNTKPATGQTYTFTPPAIVPNAPTALNFTAVTGTSMTLNWTDNAANEAGFVIFKSLDGVTYNFAATLAADAVSYDATGLTLGTLYYWRVYAFTEGFISTALSGSQSTQAGTIFGNKSIPGDYATIAAAVLDLNTGGVGPGGVTYNIAGDYTENITEPIIITMTGTASNPIVFQKSGGGANPLVTRTDAGTLATSTLGGAGDAVIQLNGTDYITFNGIDVAASGVGIEYGYYTFKPSGTDGCQYVTIQNCTVTLARGTTGVYVMGIYISNGPTTISSSVGVTVTNASGTNANITIIGNTVQNVATGIYLKGSTSLYDTDITVGQSGSGNIIQNYGINTGSTSTQYGVYFLYVENPTVTYNTFDNAGGGGAAHNGTFYGIFYSTVSGDVIGSNNSFTINQVSTGSEFNGISSPTAVTSETFNNNTLSGTFNGGSLYYIRSSNATPNKTISGNSTGVITKATGTFYGYYNLGSPSSGTETITNNNFSNISITGTTSSSQYGIYSSTASGQAKVVSGNTISNFSSTSTGSFYGVYSLVSVPNQVNNNTVTNITHAGSLYGVYVSGTATVYDNDVYALTSSGSVYGLYVSSGTVSAYRNDIYNLNTTTTTTSFVDGIYVLGGTEVNIYNNFVSDLNAPASTSTTAGVSGIYLSGGTLVNLYYNSVYLKYTSTVATNNSAALYVGSTTPTTTNMYNNVFVNNVDVTTGTRAMAFRKGGTGLTNLVGVNNNLYYAGTPSAKNVIFFDGTNTDQTLGAFQARVAPLESFSVTEMPPFVNSATAPYDLHMNTSTPTQVESGGTPVAGITTDYDGNARNATTPDIGADEFNGIGADLASPLIAYSPLPLTSSTSARTLIASITDLGSGVPTAGIGLPVLYWKINAAGTYTGATATYLSGSDYQFTFGSGVVLGDTVFYYVVAQDLATTPNVGAFPSTGAGGFTANPPAAGTPPTNPSGYFITNTSLSGDYTVGTAMFNALTGKNIYFEKVVQKVMKEVDVIVEAPQLKDEKGQVTENTSTLPAAAKQWMEVEETTWIPMENGQQYIGDLYVKKVDHPEINFPEGIDGIYSTITAAINDLNIRGVSGPVRFLLTDADYSTGETFPLTIYISNENLPTATNTVTIKPNTGVVSTVTGATAINVFGIYDDYIIIDGSNTVGGTTRDLTIVNTYLAGTFNIGVVLWNGSGKVATNTTVKNCIIESDPTETSSYGLFLNYAGGGYDNTSFVNNKIQNAKIGMQFVGFPAPGLITQNGLISGNVIGDAAKPIKIGGISGSYLDNVTIVGNEIFGEAAGNTNSSQYGITLGTEVTNAKIQKNNIHDFYYTGTTGYGCFGIRYNSDATTVTEISNNFIHNIKSDGDNSSLTFTPAGIYIITGGNINMYFNSIYMSGNTLGRGTSYDGRSTCVSVATGVTLLDIRNNIFQNSMGSFPGSTRTNRTYGIYSASDSLAYTNINYNDYFVDGVNPNVGFLGVNRADLTAWQTATAQDANSISGDPHFMSDFDLHINTAFNTVSNNGQYLAAVTTDYDGDARSVTTPDIGADEYVYVAPTVDDPTAVTATTISDSQIDVAFTPNASTNNVVIVYNLTGVFTTPTGIPTVGQPLAGGEVIAVTVSSPYSHMGLTGSTNYYYKLFSYDGANYSPGVNANATTFVTPLTPPFTQDFEGTFPPLNWTQALGLLADPVVFASGSQWFRDDYLNVTSPIDYSASINVYGTTRRGWLMTPTINLGTGTTNYQLEFDLGMTAYASTGPPQLTGTDDKFAVVISTDGGTTWTSTNTLRLWDNAGSPYVYNSITNTTTHVTINLSGYTGIVKIGFYGESTLSNADNDLFVDDVEVKEVPSTPIFSITPLSKDYGTAFVGDAIPQNFTISNNGVGTLTISAGGITLVGADPSQFTLGSITYPINLTAGQSAVVQVSFTPTTAGSKTANLQIVHNAAGSPATVPLTGSALPSGILFEDFTGTTFPPAGWTVVNNDGGTQSWIRTTTKSLSPPASAQCRYESSTLPNDDWLITPKLVVNTGDSIAFWYSAYNYPAEPEELFIQIGTTNNPNTGTWDTLGHITYGLAAWAYQSYDLSAYAGQQVYIAFISRGLYMWYLHIDDVLGPQVFVPAVDLAFTDFYQSSGLSPFKYSKVTDGEKHLSRKPLSFRSGETVGVSASIVERSHPISYEGTIPFTPLANIGFKGVIENFGTNAASYILNWSIGGSAQTAYNGPSVPSNAADTANLNYNTTTLGTFIVSGDISVTADENLANNNATPFRMRVYPDVYTQTIYDDGDDMSDTYIGYNDLTFGMKAGVRFTAPASDIKLAGVDYYCRTELASSGIWVIQVRDTSSSSGAPGAVLYQKFYTASDYFAGAGDMIFFPFDDSAPVIPAGDEYWITIKAPVGIPFPGGADFGTGIVLGHSYIEDYPDTTAWYPLIISPTEYAWVMRPVEVAASSTFQLSVSLTNGWNMVSIPGLHPVDQNVGTWWAYRVAGSQVFKYQGGYTAVPDATPGLGYWMKQDGARVYDTGDEWPAGGIQIVSHDPLTGASGWNMIGGYELSVTASNVTTVPGGLQSGPIYKYSGGYNTATTIDPGYGYWIKLTGAGQIIIPETMAKGEVVEYFPEDWGKIVLTDAAGVSYTLYAVKGEVDLSQYELPPAPMEGMYDFRFSSGRIAEDINSAIKTIDMSGVVYPLTVRVEGMDIRLMDETGKAINVNLKAGEDIVISDATIQKLKVTGELIPAQYALEQNYPNPFNPSTVIEFSLPENVGNVKLSIYNALGEKVAELVNTALTAGKYQYQWNASSVATGMYIYELRTDKFVSVKKMLLLK